MKRICTLMGICLSVILLMSCWVDKSYLLECIYKNDTDTAITCYNSMEPVRLIEIMPHEEESVLADGKGGIPKYIFSEYDRLEISNGKCIITQSNNPFGDHRSGLYNMANYVKIENSEMSRVYAYTFTDDFFKDGKPIE